MLAIYWNSYVATPSYRDVYICVTVLVPYVFLSVHMLYSHVPVAQVNRENFRQLGELLYCDVARNGILSVFPDDCDQSWTDARLISLETQARVCAACICASMACASWSHPGGTIQPHSSHIASCDHTSQQPSLPQARLISMLCMQSDMSLSTLTHI